MPVDDPFESLEQYVERLRSSPSGRGVAGRAEVAKLAAQDPMRALHVARDIEHPWYRCQAITSIVEANAGVPDALGLLDEAFSAAFSQDEPNRVASVSRWPLRQLVVSVPGDAAGRTRQLLARILEEPHGLRRLDGLRAILWAVAPSKPLRELVLEAFVPAAKASHGWRTERIIDAMAEVLLPFDRSASSRLLDIKPPSRFTRRSRTLLQQSCAADESGA